MMPFGSTAHPGQIGNLDEAAMRPIGLLPGKACLQRHRLGHASPDQAPENAAERLIAYQSAIEINIGIEQCDSAPADPVIDPENGIPLSAGQSL